MKKTLITYTHAPISPGIKGLHIMLFKLLEALKDDYEIYVLSRTAECYQYYENELQKAQPYVHLVSVPSNMTDSTYQFGKIEETIDREVGKIDKVFWFWPGMSIVTPEERIREAYDKLTSGEWSNKTVEIKDQVDGSVLQQAEMLYSVIKSQPSFIYRVGDYTEPHIEHAISYPMKLVSYYPNEKLGHTKIHDTEWLHFSDKIQEAPKEYDFIFGYTVEIPERAYLSDFCFEHIKQNDKVKLFVKDKHFSKYAPINTQLKSDEYFDMLRYSKFSLIAPSTDPAEVSLNRVYEDISRHCLPIFMKNVQYWKAFDEEVNELIRDNLVYDEDKFQYLNDFIATLDHKNLVDRFLNCSMIKKLYDRNTLKTMILQEIS